MLLPTPNPSRAPLSAALLACSLIGCAPSGVAPVTAPTATAAPARPAAAAVAPKAASALPRWLDEELREVRLTRADNGRELMNGEHVVVTQSRIVAGGTLVGRPAEILAANRLQRVDPLFEHMKASREGFKAAHPGEPFHGTVLLWVDARVPALVVKNVFQTCAFAGFPYAQFVVLRRDRNEYAALGTAARVPGPPVRGQSQDPELARLRSGGAVSGRLPPEVIQRIFRQNFGLFRTCYEKGLRKAPKLTGRVAIRFTIGKDGAVTDARTDSTTLPDVSVVACVLNYVRQLRFPAPEGGTVTVVYPIEFAPE